MEYLSFCVRFIVSFGFIHVAAKKRIFLLQKYDQYSIYIYCIFLIPQSFVDEHLGWFHTLAIVDCESTGTTATHNSISCGHKPRSREAGSYYSLLFLDFCRPSILSPIVTVLIYIFQQQCKNSSFFASLLAFDIFCWHSFVENYY